MLAHIRSLNFEPKAPGIELSSIHPNYVQVCIHKLLEG